MSSFIPNRVPSFLTHLYTASGNAYAARSYDGENQRQQMGADFIKQGLRVAIAAAICLAAYKGPTIAVVSLSTLSLPATAVALGVMHLAEGYVALKAVIVAKQFLQIPVAVAFLYTGWFTLDKCYINHFLGAGFVEYKEPKAQGSFLDIVSLNIAKKLGY